MSNYLGIDALTLQQWEETSLAHPVTCVEMRELFEEVIEGADQKLQVNK